MGGFALSLAANLIWWATLLVAGFLLARRRVWPVRIAVRKVIGGGQPSTRPEILIATFSGYRCPKGMSETDFVDALRRGDLRSLPLDESTPSIGQTVRVIKTYPSLKEVYLITTRSKEPAGASIESVPLLRAYMHDVLSRPGCEIIAREDNSVGIEEDTQVMEATFQVTKSIFESLRAYKPETILVDITGGLRSMCIGALLACLKPKQDVHLIGAQYAPTGLITESFPMVISFKARLPWMR